MACHGTRTGQGKKAGQSMMVGRTNCRGSTRGLKSTKSFIKLIELMYYTTLNVLHIQDL